MPNNNTLSRRTAKKHQGKGDSKAVSFEHEIAVALSRFSEDLRPTLMDLLNDLAWIDYGKPKDVLLVAMSFKEAVTKLQLVIDGLMESEQWREHVIYRQSDCFICGGQDDENDADDVFPDITPAMAIHWSDWTRQLFGQFLESKDRDEVKRSSVTDLALWKRSRTHALTKGGDE